MNSNFTTDFKKQAIFSAQTYGTKTTVEVDHSDLSLDEVMDVFQTLIIGMGYSNNSFKDWVIESADEYRETDAEELKEKLSEWRNEDVKDIVFNSKDGLSEAERRMDIIGQNGNDGLHYKATQKDEDEFSNDGGFDGKPHFEWGDEPEDDNLFEGDEWKLNQKLVEANERYKSEVKKMKAKQKRNNKV